MAEFTEKENDAVETITVEVLKRVSGEFDVTSIHYLNFKQKGIKDLGYIRHCENIERLDVSHNCITSLLPINKLKQLTDLNISANQITDLEPVGCLDSLQSLNAAGNLINSFDSVSKLAGLEFLKTLRLQDIVNKLDNPICKDQSYTITICYLLPSLRTLDGNRLSGPGSDLFKLCQEIDACFEAPREGPIRESPLPVPWVDDVMLSKKPSEDTNILQIEQNIRDILADCHNLNKRAEKSIALTMESTK
ncbi:leucine-rich repeat-containing protein 61-like [Antedon mediterranea]|uniref:leucine-rich repeat-containing protein 61-like n=1 Tax=Antedon mediterranea TaxID=105859 RepID=UPI003AF431DB